MAIKERIHKNKMAARDDSSGVFAGNNGFFFLHIFFMVYLNNYIGYSILRWNLSPSMFLPAISHTFLPWPPLELNLQNKNYKGITPRIKPVGGLVKYINSIDLRWQFYDVYAKGYYCPVKLRVWEIVLYKGQWIL